MMIPNWMEIIKFMFQTTNQFWLSRWKNLERNRNRRSGIYNFNQDSEISPEQDLTEPGDFTKIELVASLIVIPWE